MYSKKVVIYKLHAGWFINCSPGSLSTGVFLLNLKVFSVEILQKEGKIEYKISGRQAVSNSNQGTMIVCHKRGVQDRKQYNISNIYTV